MHFTTQVLDLAQLYCRRIQTFSDLQSVQLTPKMIRICRLCIDGCGMFTALNCRGKRGWGLLSNQACVHSYMFSAKQSEQKSLKLVLSKIGKLASVAGPLLGWTYSEYFWFKYYLGQKYYAPQVQPDRDSNSRPPDHDSTFHVTETPALATRPI